MGDNGTGKSTLLNLITGALSPCEGTISRHSALKWPSTHSIPRSAALRQVARRAHRLFVPREVPREGRQFWRSQIGRFGITGSHQTNPIGQLSDGLETGQYRNTESFRSVANMSQSRVRYPCHGDAPRSSARRAYQPLGHELHRCPRRCHQGLLWRCRHRIARLRAFHVSTLRESAHTPQVLFRRSQRTSGRSRTRRSSTSPRAMLPLSSEFAVGYLGLSLTGCPSYKKQLQKRSESEWIRTKWTSR